MAQRLARQVCMTVPSISQSMHRLACQSRHRYLSSTSATTPKSDSLPPRIEPVHELHRAQAASPVAAALNKQRSRPHKKPKKKKSLNNPLKADPVATQSSSSARSDGLAIAFTSAEEYDIDALRTILWESGLLGRGDDKDAVNLMGEAVYLPQWPLRDTPSIAQTEQSGEVFIFENGSYVTWGLGEHTAAGFLDKVIRGGTNESSVEKERYPECQSESVNFIVDLTSETGIRDDAITIGQTDLDSSARPTSVVTSFAPPAFSKVDSSPHSLDVATGSSIRRADQISSGASLPTAERDLQARLALSSGLTRSTKLDHYETELDKFLEGLSNIPDLLAKGSEAPIKKKEIVKSFGFLLRMRQKLNLNEENLLDPPDFLWSSPALEEYHEAVSNSLDVQQRLDIVNQKLDWASNLQSTLMELLSTKTSHRLEWIIIFIIFFETAHAVYIHLN
ncbi:hypothetical protein E5Q_05045 [Mixia osmundae IAM 14324]|uniref:DUF155 domain-containing protein n=1 Tax=Mixia osmundae (strain CBS 9802 / IAM 14324 / JCM 22182 / KY 12970) TaxID=764103 RepID=G7E699_MIXOS|nr:hypothetical protein E5Q_05045 [Mixia osmundae IAM 14324]